MTEEEVVAQLRAYPAKASVAKMQAFAEAISELYKQTQPANLSSGGVSWPFRKACMKRIMRGDFEVAMKWAERDTPATASQLLAIKTLIFG